MFFGGEYHRGIDVFRSNNLYTDISIHWYNRSSVIAHKILQISNYPKFALKVLVHVGHNKNKCQWFKW